MIGAAEARGDEGVDSAGLESENEVDGLHPLVFTCISVVVLGSVNLHFLEWVFSGKMRT